MSEDLWLVREISFELSLFNYGGIGMGRAVLVAISIPIFTSQLEKSREATDMANIRSAYAEVSAAVLTEANTGKATYTAASTSSQGGAYEVVDIKQKQAGWQTTETEKIGGENLPTIGSDTKSVTVIITTDGTCTLTANTTEAASTTVTIGTK